MRWLVTGGAGFIGSHCVARLLARGDEVVALDNYSTGSAANLAALVDEPRLRVFHGSVCDELVVDEAIAGCQAVLHLAAAVGVRRILERQVQGIMTNLRGTEVVLRAAAGHGKLPVFLASSSEVYGKGLKAPFSEDDDSVLGATSLHRWSYACAKAMDEFLALAYFRERELPVVVGRFFNITGPGQSGAYGMVLPRFCQWWLRGEPIEVYGDGAQSRCFLHVTDCIDAVLALMETPAARGTVVNIGGEEEVTIQALAERVQTVGGREVGIRHRSYQEAYPQGGFEDLRRRVPDTGRLRRLVPDWRPRYDLDAIISDCLAACRAREESPCP